MQFTRFCRDFDLVAKYAFSQAPSCTNFLPPGSASDSRTGLNAAQKIPLALLFFHFLEFLSYQARC